MISRRSRRLPGPGPVASLRRFTSFFDDPVPWYADLHEQYGDTVALRLGHVRMISCRDPATLQRVLVKDAAAFRKGAGLQVTRLVLGNGMLTADGEVHRRHRRLAAPAFTPRSVEQLAEGTVRLTSQELDAWPEQGIMCVAHAAFDLSLRTAGVGLFGIDFTMAERAALHEAADDLNDGYRLVVAPGGMSVYRARLTPLARRTRRGRDQVEAVVRSMIEQRRSAIDIDQLQDVLSRLIAAREVVKVDDAGDASSEPSTGFDDLALRDEAATMLLAGHDTTAGSLGWCLGLLALHPEQQSRARQEVDAVLAGRLPAAADLRSLPYVGAVVSETLRLHPSVYSTVRSPLQDYELPGGEVVAAGTDIIVCIGGIHRDPRWWPDPDRFDPGRFVSPDDHPPRHKLAYLPFGAGPRVCIGSSFALQSLALTVAVVLQRYELAATKDTVLRADTGFTRRPAAPLPVRVIARAGTSS